MDSVSKKKYTNVHLGVVHRPELHERSKKVKLPDNAIAGYDVFMLGMFNNVLLLAMVIKTNMVL